jgi:opacity protein-like surface antigen
MRKSSKFIVVAGALAALAVPSAAMAAPPVHESGGWTFKDNAPNVANVVGQSDAQIIHNGWAVGGNKHTPDTDSVYSGGDQTTAPGSRADLVQAALGH